MSRHFRVMSVEADKVKFLLIDQRTGNFTWIDDRNGATFLSFIEASTIRFVMMAEDFSDTIYSLHYGAQHEQGRTHNQTGTGRPSTGGP